MASSMPCYSCVHSFLNPKEGVRGKIYFCTLKDCLVGALDNCNGFKPRWAWGAFLRMKAYAEFLQSSPHGTKVLDVGCAEGELIEYLKLPHFKLYGVDKLPEFSQICLSRGYMEAKVADVEKTIPYPDNFFDTAFAGETLEHLLDTDKFLDEVQRVLKPEALFFLTTPNLCYIGNIYFILKGQQLSFIERPDARWGHISYYSPDILKKQLRNHGFTDITFHPEPYAVPIKKKMKRLLLRLFLSPRFVRKRWGIHLVATAKKA